MLFGEFSKNFTIDSTLGVILPREPFDFEMLEDPSLENTRIIHLTVRARDWGSPSLFSDAPLIIYIQDVNDNAPQFEKIFYNKTVPENIPSETSVVQVCAR